MTNILLAISPFFEIIKFVSNGKLTDISRSKISQITSDITERKNEGFDVSAYKQILESISDEELKKFDEIILMNHTIMGPVYPFSEVFSEMDNQNVDFWGLTIYHEFPEIKIKKCRYGYFPEHIQSHFIAIRKSLFTSLEFKQYWNELPEIKSYHDSVCYHEAIFTKHFADMGYKWTVYADLDDKNNNLCPILYSPAKLITETRCPVFKRRSFFHDIQDLQHWSRCTQAKELIELLKNTGFDIGLIWENILRTCNLADVQKCIGNFIIPEKKGDISSIRTALIIHSYYRDQISICRKMADSMPQNSDIYIFTPNPENKPLICQAFSDGRWNKLVISECKNQGRDVSTLLVAAKDIIDHYDIVCFAHDKKSHCGDKTIIGEEFSKHCIDNILGSREYVEAVIDEFVRFPYLGILAPPPPYHYCYQQVIGNEWTCNYEKVCELATALGINVIMDRYTLPSAPLGTMFWFRPQALKPILAHKWEYNDFPVEPNSDDGTILHAIERLYVFAAQQAGFYSAWCLKDDNANRYVTTIYSMLQNEVQNKKYGKICDYIFFRIKEYIKKHSSAKIQLKLKQLYNFFRK